MKTHWASHTMHQNLTLILLQLNYGKNMFIVLIPGTWPSHRRLNLLPRRVNIRKWKVRKLKNRRTAARHRSRSIAMINATRSRSNAMINATCIRRWRAKILMTKAFFHLKMTREKYLLGPSIPGNEMKSRNRDQCCKTFLSFLMIALNCPVSFGLLNDKTSKYEKLSSILCWD